MTKVKSFFLIIITVLITGFFSSFDTIQSNVKLLQINAQWNRKNDINLDHLPTFHNNIKIKKEFALLESQTPKIKESIKAVPVIILIVDGKQKYQWTADLSFRLNITKEQVKSVISKLLP
tara:strand:+ start:562 stop:921 length:360 start_codon:yes stop_codon:yes gene_type:complete